MPLGHIPNREVIKLNSGAVGGDSSLQDRGVAHYLLPLLFSLVSYFLVFSFVSYIKNTKKLVTLLLLVAVIMGSTENSKLCDFTSHKNNDFICTPIGPPATSAPSYEIKPTLLNLVMKEQFSGAGDVAGLHLFFG